MTLMPTPDDVIKEILDAIKAIATKDAESIGGFSKRQLERIAKYTVLVGKAAKVGAYDDEADLKQALAEAEEMLRDLVLALRGLALITLEKIWNAVVKIVWGAIEKGLGAAIPIPLPKL